jgi:hypothetical protein
MELYEVEKVYKRKQSHRDKNFRPRSVLVKKNTTHRKGAGKIIYPSYMLSKEWLERRRAYCKKYGGGCAICGTLKKTEMHHMSYLHLGNERDNELVVLCHRHHTNYHRLNGVQGNMIKKTHAYIQAEKEKLTRKTAEEEAMGTLQANNP